MSKAKIVRKIVIQSKLRTLSPLRIGSGENDGLTDILILKNKQGEPFIPGTSMAGVLRSSISDIYGEEAAEALFGKVNGEDATQSLVNISDVVLLSRGIVVRDGVAIDELTGVAKTGAKFDFEALERGATGDLTLEITIRQQNVVKPINLCYVHNEYAVQGDCYGELAATLADLLTGGVSVGALTTKGYGKIAGKEAVKVYDFDFTESVAAQRWLTYISEDRLVAASYVGTDTHAQAPDSFYMEVSCALQGALLIRDFDVDDAKQEGDATLSAVQLKSGEDYVIPGTSWKGVLRSRAYKILLQLTGYDEASARRWLNEIFGFANDNERSGKRSKLSVEETYISPRTLTALRQTRNRIDRFTGSTIDSALFCEEPVWQRERGAQTVTLKLRLQKCTQAEVGLMLLLLKDLWLGNLNIGSGKGIGRGVLRGRSCVIHYAGKAYELREEHGFTIQGDKNELEACVQALVGELNG